jgi:adenosylhomocysteine nucleosidase
LERLTINKTRACILTALKAEAKPYFDAMGAHETFKHGKIVMHEGIINGIPVAVAAGGVRHKNAANAAFILTERYQRACLIMSGTAGGLDSSLKIGDTVVADEIVFHDRLDDHTIYLSDDKLIACCQYALDKNPPGHPVYYGRMATGDAFIKKSNRADIIENVHPLCVDMETAAAARVCFDRDVPFIAVRSITDVEDNVSHFTFYKNMAAASRRSFLVVNAMLKEMASSPV